MTTLDTAAQSVRARAAAVQMPSLATILVTLVGLIPFLLGWTFNALWQGVRLVVAAFREGWARADARLGAPKAVGGS